MKEQLTTPVRVLAKSINDRPPKLAEVLGTNEEFGFTRRFLKSSYVDGVTREFLVYRPGIYECHEGRDRTLWIITEKGQYDCTDRVPRYIGDYMRENGVSRMEAWERIYDDLRTCLAYVKSDKPNTADEADEGGEL